MFHLFCNVLLVSPKLVKVAGCNMWVLEETEDPYNDPSQTGHPRPKKVHAQQYPACSHKDTAMDQDALSLRIAGKH